MQTPVEISFRGVPRTRAIVERINAKAARLDRLRDNITSCRVVIERPQKHQQAGNAHRLLIELRLPPGHHLVVRREPTMNEQHDDLKTIIGEAFDAMERQVKDLTQKQRGEVKTNPATEGDSVAIVAQIKDGYGFLQASDGRSIYFHRNAVLSDDFERLEPGTAVRFVEAAGEEGPQASTVQIVDKPAAGGR